MFKQIKKSLRKAFKTVAKIDRITLTATIKFVNQSDSKKK